MENNFKSKRKMSDVGKNILKKRYFHEGEKEWGDVVNRVINFVTPKWSDEEKEIMRDIILHTYFIPNSPCLVNSGGKKHKGLNACFVVDFPDDIVKIYKTKLDFALIARKGGGCGTSLTKIRPEAQKVSGSTHGYAGGGVKFADTISHDADALTQSGFRSMAIMFTESVYHPDIIKFITAKHEEGRIANANISVVVDDDFMKAVENDGEIELKFPDTTHPLYDSFNGGIKEAEALGIPIVVFNKVKARNIFDMIVEGMWRNGEPGMLFKDRIDDSPYKYTGQEIFGTNPCSEQPLPPNGVCNLGSIDLSKFMKNDKEVDWDLLEATVRYGVRFLDAVIDASEFPTPEIEKWARENRAIGLGVMGYADLCLMKEIAYGSEEALKLLADILSFISTHAEQESKKLGEEKGVPELCKLLPDPRRNVTLTTVAPTGCQRKDTLVTTDKGFFELMEFGWIVGERWQNLTNVNVSQEKEYKRATRFYINGVGETKKIKLSSGIELEATANHKYRVLDKGSYVWKEAGALSVGDLLVSPLGTYKTSHNTPLFPIYVGNGALMNGLYFPTTVSVELAKFLGMLFGSGSLDKKGVKLHFDFTEDKYLYGVYLGKKIFGIAPTISFNGRSKKATVYFKSELLVKWMDKNNFNKHSSKNFVLPMSIRSFNTENMNAFFEGFTLGLSTIETYNKKFAQQWITIARGLGEDFVFSEYTVGLRQKVYRIYEAPYFKTMETEDVTKSLLDAGLDNCTVDSVVEVKDSLCYTYDIEVPENNCYIANGVVSHNTVSLLAGCSSGIEPIFSEITIRNDKTGTYTFENDLASKPYFRCAVSANGATEVTWEEHIDTLATAQEFIDSGVSKTVNFPTMIHRDTIKKAVISAWKKGCKGLAVYRNGSRKQEVLSPKNVKRDKCPICGNEMVEIEGKKKCLICNKDTLIENTSTYYN